MSVFEKGEFDIDGDYDEEVPLGGTLSKAIERTFTLYKEKSIAGFAKSGGWEFDLGDHEQAFATHSKPSEGVNVPAFEKPIPDIRPEHIIVSSVTLVSTMNTLPGNPTLGVVMPDSNNIQGSCFVASNNGFIPEPFLHTFSSSASMVNKEIYKADIGEGSEISYMTKISSNPDLITKGVISSGNDHVIIPEDHPFVQLCVNYPGNKFEELGFSKETIEIEGEVVRAESLDDLKMPYKFGNKTEDGYILSKEGFEHAARLVKSHRSNYPTESVKQHLKVKIVPACRGGWASLATQPIYHPESGETSQYSEQDLSTVGRVGVVITMRYHVLS